LWRSTKWIGGLFRRSFNKIKADFEALNAKSTLKNKT
jgi:hypothetical protein